MSLNHYSITSIYYSTKLDANTPDTFKSVEQGNLGAFLGGQPYYYFGPSYPTGRPYFNVANTTELPSVVVFYGHRESLLQHHLTNSKLSCLGKSTDWFCVFLQRVLTPR